MRPLKIIAIYLLYAFLIGGCANFRAPHPIHLPKTLPTALPIKEGGVALVLSGGGARAIAHAGVIEELEKQGIPIDYIVGSSAGALIGSLYADNPRADILKKKIIALNKWDLLDPSLSASFKMFWQLTGPVEGNKLRRYLQDNLRAQHFNALKIPLVVVTTDVETGQPFVIRSGPLVPALHASSALPIIFSPVKLYGKTLVDGGVSHPIPVDIAKQFKPKLIIAVDIGTSPNYGPVNNIYQLGVRSLHISYFKLSELEAKDADILIHPAIDKYSMFDDHANDELYLAGKIAARKALPMIRAKALARLNSP